MTCEDTTLFAGDPDIVSHKKGETTTAVSPVLEASEKAKRGQ